MRKNVNLSKLIDPQRGFFQKLLILLQYVFLVSFQYLEGVVVITSCVTFDLYSGDILLFFI